jgi:RimJ/RimL family protein N-acetyltransferase
VGGRTRSRELLTTLKKGAGDGLPGLCLPVGSPVVALLRPLGTTPGTTGLADIARLTNWRNRFVTAFLTEFEATPERTARWLATTVHQDDTKIIFMVDELDGRTVGYMGLAAINWDSGYFEADSIVRGEPAPRGLMGESLKTLMRWAAAQFGFGDPWVRVRSDNPALRFYEEIGFEEQFCVPLRRTEEHGMIVWIQDERMQSTDPHLVHMRWNRDR